LPAALSNSPSAVRRRENRLTARQEKAERRKAVFRVIEKAVENEDILLSSVGAISGAAAHYPFRIAQGQEFFTTSGKLTSVIKDGVILSWTWTGHVSGLVDVDFIARHFYRSGIEFPVPKGPLFSDWTGVGRIGGGFDDTWRFSDIPVTVSGLGPAPASISEFISREFIRQVSFRLIPLMLLSGAGIGAMATYLLRMAAKAAGKAATVSAEALKGVGEIVPG